LRDAPAHGEDLRAYGVVLSEASMIAVTISFTGDHDTFVSEMRASGILVANSIPEVVEAYVSIDQLTELADHPSVISVRALTQSQHFSPSAGVDLMGSLNWNANGFDGSGVKIGVIDGGFAKFRQLQGSQVPSAVV